MILLISLLFWLIFDIKKEFLLFICLLFRTFAAENETDGEKTYCIVDAVGSIPANADVVVVALS